METFLSQTDIFSKLNLNNTEKIWIKNKLQPYFYILNVEKTNQNLIIEYRSCCGGLKTVTIKWNI